MLRRTTLLLATLICTNSVMAVDWESVTGTEVNLFYPGQSAWEWVWVPSTHGGAKKVRSGQTCQDCHEGEQTEMGANILSGDHELEPSPLSGQVASLQATLQVVHTDTDLAVQISWPDTGKKDGSGSTAVVRASLFFADENSKEMSRFGCWGACHKDLKGMSDDEGLTKYVSSSRTKNGRTGGSTNYKSGSELTSLREAGKAIEFWQVAVDPDGKVSASDGYILDKRHTNSTTAVAANAKLENGRWVIEMARPLAADDQRRSISAGTSYTLGLAIHDNHSEGRAHLVSMEHTFALDAGDVDIIVSKQ